MSLKVAEYPQKMNTVRDVQRPVEVTIPEMIDKIHDIVLGDRRIKIREIVEAHRVESFQFCKKNWA